MQIAEILKAKDRTVHTARPGLPIRDAMSLLISSRIGCLPVIDDQALVGIISDKDIFHEAFRDPRGFQERLVSDLMTEEVIVGLEDDEVGYIAAVMTQNRIRHIPIVRDNKLVGLVSIGDIVKSQMSEIHVENRYLWQYINGQYPG